MARPKSFDVESALDDAITVFRDHGFEGASAQMLVDHLGIGRQSLYDTFGDKWQLYCKALRRYALIESQAHCQALATGPRAIDGIHAMVDRVVREARTPCLGISSIAEFGCSRPDLVEINAAADHVLRAAMADRVRTAQADGDLAGSLDPDSASTFLIASFAAIRLAARGGADQEALEDLGRMAFRALR